MLEGSEDESAWILYDGSSRLAPIVYDAARVRLPVHDFHRVG